MSFSSTIGRIIVFFAIIGLLVNLGGLIFAFVSCDLGIMIIDSVNCAELFFAYVQFGIGLVVSIFWIGIGTFLSKRK